MKLPPPDATNIEKLEALLEQLDFNNEDARKAAGVSVQTVYRWLNGSHPIPAMALRLFELMLIIDKANKQIRVSWCGFGENDELPQG